MQRYWGGKWPSKSILYTISQIGVLLLLLFLYLHMKPYGIHNDDDIADDFLCVCGLSQHWQEWAFYFVYLVSTIVFLNFDATPSCVSLWTKICVQCS